jgi:hypothetical protein
MPDFLALYGAVVGSAAALGFGWNVYRDWPRLKIKISKGHFHPGANEPLVFVEAVNVCRRPITINGGGGLAFRDGSHIWFNNGAHELPKELAEGQSIALWCTQATLKKTLGKRRGDLPTNVWFKDASDKLHRARIPRGFRDWMIKLAGGSS